MCKKKLEGTSCEGLDAFNDTWGQEDVVLPGPGPLRCCKRVCSASWKVRDDLETGEELEESDGLQAVLDWFCRLIWCGEEELYCQRSKLYRFRDAEWKEQIRENRTSAKRQGSTWSYYYCYCFSEYDYYAYVSELSAFRIRIEALLSPREPHGFQERGVGDAKLLKHQVGLLGLPRNNDNEKKIINMTENWQ